MESKNRTRHAQRQFADFMKDAGCDPGDLEDEFQPKARREANPLRKTLHRHADYNGELSYPAPKTKRIQKTVRRPERVLPKPGEPRTATGNSPSSSCEPAGGMGQNVQMQVEQQQDKQTSAQQKQALLPHKQPVQPVQAPKKLFAFPLCVNKAGNNFYGYFGHATVLLTEPVIEGSYYMEVSILSPFHPNHPKGKQFECCIRIGVCKAGQHLLVPLGGAHSYAYKSKDGSVIHANAALEKHQGPPYKPGDVVGVLLHMSPPFRFMKEGNSGNGVNEGSRLVFSRNGVAVSEMANIEQHFYHFGVSLFNWANVNVNLGPHFKYKPDEGCKPILRAFEEEYPYSDIKT